MYDYYLWTVWNFHFLSIYTTVKCLSGFFCSLCKVRVQIWITSFKWGPMKLCRLKNCKVTSLQSLPRPRMDLGPHSSMAILAERDEAVLIIFDCELWQLATLLKIVIESLSMLHLKDLIYICLEPKDKDPFA